MGASAYVVGLLDGPGAALIDLAQRLHFDAVLRYAGIGHAEQQSLTTPVCYFLFAEVSDIDGLRPIAETVRFSASKRVRFSPLIYFCENPSIETINACINMGFDDVIAMPLARDRLRERLDRHIGQPVTYYETSGYFGPDRRDRLTAPRRPAESRVGGQFRRLEIVRHLISGVHVVRDELYTPIAV